MSTGMTALWCELDLGIKLVIADVFIHACFSLSAVFFFFLIVLCCWFVCGVWIIAQLCCSHILFKLALLSLTFVFDFSHSLVHTFCVSFQLYCVAGSSVMCLSSHSCVIRASHSN